MNMLVADFTDSQAVIVRNGGTAEVFGYKSDVAAQSPSTTPERQSQNRSHG